LSALATGASFVSSIPATSVALGADAVIDGTRDDFTTMGKRPAAAGFHLRARRVPASDRYGFSNCAREKT
jgi:hypothetical protein